MKGEDDKGAEADEEMSEEEEYEDVDEEKRKGEAGDDMPLD